MPEPLHFIGLLRSTVSWAKVSRELVRALAREGAYVSAVSLKGYLYDEGFPLSAEVEQAIERQRRDGWDVALDYPANFARLNGKRKAGIVIYEADRLPAHWVEAINGNLDLAVVPSEFCLEAAARSGVEHKKLRLVPFGTDPSDKIGTVPILPTQHTFVTPVTTTGYGNMPGVDRMARKIGTVPIYGGVFSFLTVGAPHVRKGLRETVEAFRAAFSAQEDVGLIVKCPPMSRLGRRPWEYRRIEDFLAEGRDRRITLIEGTLSDEDMAALYRSCDVYVQASYGEAFGLAAVEAAASGKPVITTNWGAAGGIFDEKSAFVVDYDLVDASAIAYDWHGPTSDAGSPPQMARPRVESLAAAMKLAYEDAALRKKKGEAALAAVQRLTWQAAAKGLLRALGE